jgi:hypothetical protein
MARGYRNAGLGYSHSAVKNFESVRIDTETLEPYKTLIYRMGLQSPSQTKPHRPSTAGRRLPDRAVWRHDSGLEAVPLVTSFES